MSQVKNNLSPGLVLIHSRPEQVLSEFKRHLTEFDRIEAFSPFHIRFINYDIPSANYYMITSANAVDFLPENFVGNLIAIGDQTRQALDHKNISYDPQIYSIIDDMRHHKDRFYNQSLAHLGGRDRSPASINLSNEWGITHVPLYEAILIREMDEALRAFITSCESLVFVFFSARCAQGFTTMMDCAKLTYNKDAWRAVCISERVSDSLDKAFFAQVHTAPLPNREAVIKIIKDVTFKNLK